MTSKKILNREDILNAKDLALERLEMPEWGGDVFIRGIRADEHEDMESLYREDGTVTECIRVAYISKCTVDEKGKRLFTEEDIAGLRMKSSIPVRRLFDAIAKRCGFSQEAKKDIKKN